MVAVCADFNLPCKCWPVSCLPEGVVFGAGIPCVGTTSERKISLHRRRLGDLPMSADHLLLLAAIIEDRMRPHMMPWRLSAVGRVWGNVHSSGLTRQRAVNDGSTDGYWAIRGPPKRQTLLFSLSLSLSKRRLFRQTRNIEWAIWNRRSGKGQNRPKSSCCRNPSIAPGGTKKSRRKTPLRHCSSQSCTPLQGFAQHMGGLAA